jgi:tetratricopeptide (TPR) repeat protein
LLVGLSLAVSKATSAQSLAEVAALNAQVEELYRQGRYSEATPLAQRVLRIREAALGLNHPDVGTSINNLAILYQSQGLYRDAEPLFERALAISEKAFGANHPNVATSLNNLAELYQNEGRYADAETLLKAVVGDKREGPRVQQRQCCTFIEQSCPFVSSASSLCRSRAAL